MDGSRFEWEMRQEQGQPQPGAVKLDERAMQVGLPPELEAVRIARAAEIAVAERPGAPMAAWAPVLIWTAFGVTAAISFAL